MQKSTLLKAMGVAFATIAISACSSNDVEEGEAFTTATTQPVIVEEPTKAVEPVKLSAEELEAQANAKLRDTTTFYFDFDESSIKSADKASLTAHAKYLDANASAKVKLEGYADERGTPEYNLALGERRAVAVRRFLMANGADAAQISVVSFGEEKPAATGHNEASWAKNRRVEIKYQSM